MAVWIVGEDGIGGGGKTERMRLGTVFLLSKRKGISSVHHKHTKQQVSLQSPE